MSEKKKPSILFPLILIGGVVLALGAYTVLLKARPPQQAEEKAPSIATQAPDENTPVSTMPTPPTMAEQNAKVVETKVLTLPAPTPQIPVTTSTDPKVEEMMGVRKVGSDNAPIKIVEYASLTCGHCASFHQNDFPRLKAEYIDTGKVQFIFKEFPLNQPAVDASKLLRCLPVERYESFMTLLFNEQAKWAYASDYLTPLKQNAKLAGLSDAEADSCLKNTELQNRIVGDMKAGSEKYKIQSTPTFILNDGLKTIVGHQPYGFFKETLDTLLGSPAVPSDATETSPSAAPVPSLAPAPEPQPAAPALETK